MLTHAERRLGGEESFLSVEGPISAGVTPEPTRQAPLTTLVRACACAGQRICSLAEVSEFEREVERLNKLRDAVFLRGCIPWWNAAAGYAAFAVLAVVVIPLLYHPVKWCALPSECPHP